MGLKTKRKERPLRNRTQNVVYQYQAAPTSSASCSPTSRSAENNPCPSDFEQGRLLPKTQELSAPISLHRDLEPEFHDVSAALEVGTTSDSLMDAPVSIPLPMAPIGGSLGPIASQSSSSSTLPGSLHLHNSSSITNPSKSYHAFSTPSSSSTIYRRGSSAEQSSTSSSGVVGCEGGGGGGNGGGSDNGGNAGNERGGRGGGLSGGLGGGLVGGLVGGFFTTNYISSHSSSSAVHSSIPASSSSSSTSSSSHCQISSAKRIQKNPSRKGRIADKLGWKSRADPNSSFGSATVSSCAATALSSSPSPPALTAMPSTSGSGSESKIEHGSGNVLYTNVMITTLHSSSNNNLNANDSNNNSNNSNNSNNGEASYAGSSGTLIDSTHNNIGSKKEYEREKGGGAMTIASRQQTRLPLASNNLLNKIAAAAGLKIVGEGEEDDDSDLCPTCLDPYSELNPKYVTACGHGFHLQCLLEW
eukprot:CAMPEP_0175080596 /NCGR_PEP_ID=MMETSP0052_2-20121109/25607_1 /TAXON_ID=51329 ORGANISM="Polytomella parva, Strain SAG 63-3" /NCGR_SAMPLE_ID=MMETSP0052_2 /ASSEMBLY_ACC=CAM_ASM_000194 /LENGTH=472 /DNA_ID=CAMNT_0016351337 /DNA_START=326 /DNA_END=1741 /DNA_ORIENTATION=-